VHAHLTTGTARRAVDTLGESLGRTAGTSAGSAVGGARPGNGTDADPNPRRRSPRRERRGPCRAMGRPARPVIAALRAATLARICRDGCDLAELRMFWLRLSRLTGCAPSAAYRGPV